MGTESKRWGVVAGFCFLLTTAHAATSCVRLTADAPSQWRSNADGGNTPAVSQGPANVGQPTLRFAYTNGARGYGNSRLGGLHIPPNSYGVRFQLFVENASPLAAMHLWFHEKDGDLWKFPLVPEDGLGLAARTGVWRPVLVPFGLLSYQPRGDKHRAFLSCDRLLMGFNYGDQTVRISGLSFVVRDTACPPADEASVAVAPLDPAGRRIAVLREPGVPRQPGHADPERLARLLREAGFQPIFLRASDLCNASRFNRHTADLLVLPNAPFFPSSATANFRDYLKAGGAFFSLGGYAFDQLCAYEDGAWMPDALWPMAGEIDRVRGDSGRLNTRYGEPCDTMKLSPDQIGVFDPSFLLRNVASMGPSDGQCVASGVWRENVVLEGPAAVAMTGNNSAVFPDVNARWIPLLEAYDRLGRSRGPVLALALNHRGPYAGSSWGFAGVTNRDLFNGDFPALDRLFVAACVRLLSPAYLVTLKSDFACYTPGETVSLRVRVHAPETPNALAVRFRVDGVVVAETSVTGGVVAAAWPLSARLPDFHACSAELLSDGRVIDVLRSGFCVANPGRLAEGPSLLLRDNALDVNGRPLFLIGANTTGMMWYSDNEDPLVWRRDFEQMGDFGIGALRILHFSPFCNEANPASHSTSADLARRPEKLCRATDAIVQLAQPNQVAIFLSLHDWLPLDLSDADLAAQGDWDRFWAARYRAVPGMMYDIQNEPDTALADAAVLRPLYEVWLRNRYGSLDAAFQTWRRSGAAAAIDFKAGAAGWTDLRVRDNELFRAWVFARWQRANGDAVHAAAPDALVTVGHLQNPMSSEKALDTSGVDFLNVHHYGAVDELRGVLKLTDRRFEGKSFSIGEFGSRTAHSARNRGEWGDPAAASISQFLAVGHYALGMGASFVANWSWKDFRDCVFPWGINHADLTPKPVVEAYRNMALLFRTAEPRYVPPRLYLVLPDSFRFGAEQERVNEALRRSTDWLLQANVPFNVINETALDRLPVEAHALVWPMAVCPSDASFARVAAFVRGGGRLLFSGDPRFNEDRTPTRLGRLAELGLTPTAASPESPFARVDLSRPALMQRSKDGGVMWLTHPVELADDRGSIGPALYRRFLDEVSGVERVHAVPDDGTLLVFDVALRDGRALVAVNAAASARPVTVSAHAGYPEVRATLAAGRTLYVQFDADGRVRAAAAQGGLAVGGADVLRGPGDWAVLSLDGRDVREAAQLAMFPFGSGTFGLTRRADAPNLAGEVGEFRAGRWTPLETQQLQQTDGVLNVGADAATACDIRILSTGAEQSQARGTLERLLRVRPETGARHRRQP